MSKRVLEVMRNSTPVSKDIELELLFLISGTVAVLSKYYRGETNLTLDEIRDYLKNKIHWLFNYYKSIL